MPSAYLQSLTLIFQYKALSGRIWMNIMQQIYTVKSSWTTNFNDIREDRHHYNIKHFILNIAALMEIFLRGTCFPCLVMPMLVQCRSHTRKKRYLKNSTTGFSRYDYRVSENEIWRSVICFLENDNFSLRQIDIYTLIFTISIEPMNEFL